MKNRTDSFNTGSYAQDQDSEPMDHVSNRSKIRSANKKGHLRGSDGLFNALSAPAEMYQASHKAHLPTDNHRYHHTASVSPTGAHYNPRGEFGRTERTGAGSTYQIYGGNRRSAPSANAVPGNQNSRNGGNGVPGHPSNRAGENAVGYPPHRSGSNAVGNAPNRFGENALSGRFRPHFSKPHGNRV